MVTMLRWACLLWIASGAGLPLLSAQERAGDRLDVRLVTDEAQAALTILGALQDHRPVSADEWRRLFATEGYRRLQQRERAIGRQLDDTAFRRFLQSPEEVGRTHQLRATLAAWTETDLAGAAGRALAYLPSAAHIRARLYPVIKPASNSFVFETATDSAAIFLYLDPAVNRAKLENTLAHELHHIGFASACRKDTPRGAEPRATAIDWLSAFGEGVAMLAAAGGPDIHPHAVSDTTERNRWDRDMLNAPADLKEVERFLLAILDGKLTGDAITEKGMSFFGIQGPWYTVGYLMASTIERASGRARLIEVLCNPLDFLLAYDRAAATRANLPRWSPELLSRLRP